MARQRAGRTARAQPVEDPAALAKAVEEAGLAQKLQMARDTRLALPEDLRQLAHGQLTAGAQHEEAQPRRLGDRAQRDEQLLH